ncbi:hypothetical protein HYX00_03570 [Candidatus Woesearchaeota archaeon]|nr:hypothetical protein [Candidatus Woesearchaeota archaeon]
MNSLKSQKICLIESDREKTNNLRIRLSKEFQYKIFSELVEKFSSSELAKMFGISRSMIYHYKNYRVNNISIEMFYGIKCKLNLSEKDVGDNIIETFRNQDVMKKCLESGIKFRRNQLKDFRDEIPKVHEIIENNHLNLEKWFSYYLKLINFGCREIKNIQIEGEILKVTYTNYVNNKKKTFITLFPRKMNIDEDFQYFFGLWVGDKAGGGRIGIINKNKVINTYTASYLTKLYQKVEFVLYLHNDNTPNLDYNLDKIIRINSPRNGWAISVHAINRILKSFFEYLQNDLDNFLDLIPNKNIFFAGLFDAEGNVFLEDKCFRWASKNELNIRIFTKHLKELDLFKRFDGSNLVTNNRELFFKEVFPFIKHPQKINDTQLIMLKEGILNKRFKNILEFVQDNPKKTKREIAKALKMVKVYSQLKFLEYLELVKMEDYPHKIMITNKGSEALLRGGKDL